MTTSGTFGLVFLRWRDFFLYFFLLLLVIVTVGIRVVIFVGESFGSKANFSLKLLDV